MLRAAVLIAIAGQLAAAVAQTSPRDRLYVQLQDEWQVCLLENGRRFAATDELLADIIDASFAICQPHEDALLAFYKSDPDSFTGEFMIAEVLPEIRKHFGSRTKAVVIDERADGSK